MKLLSRRRYEEIINELELYERRLFDLSKRIDRKQQELLEERKNKAKLQEMSEIVSNEKIKLLDKQKQLKKSLRKSNGALGGFKKENNKLKRKLDNLLIERENLIENNQKYCSNVKILNDEKEALRREINQIKYEKTKLQTSVIQLNEKNKILSSNKNPKNYLRREERKEK